MLDASNAYNSWQFRHGVPRAIVLSGVVGLVAVADAADGGRACDGLGRADLRGRVLSQIRCGAMLTLLKHQTCGRYPGFRKMRRSLRKDFFCRSGSMFSHAHFILRSKVGSSTLRLSLGEAL